MSFHQVSSSHEKRGTKLATSRDFTCRTCVKAKCFDGPWLSPLCCYLLKLPPLAKLLKKTSTLLNKTILNQYLPKTNRKTHQPTFLHCSSGPPGPFRGLQVLQKRRALRLRGLSEEELQEAPQPLAPGHRLLLRGFRGGKGTFWNTFGETKLQKVVQNVMKS